ncbi:MAG: heme exporter protein CcmD [Pseudomonadota bacterium]
MTGEYAPFVISAYVIAGLGIAAILGWAYGERRAAKAALRRAERAQNRSSSRDGVPSRSSK